MHYSSVRKYLKPYRIVSQRKTTIVKLMRSRRLSHQMMTTTNSASERLLLLSAKTQIETFGALTVAP